MPSSSLKVRLFTIKTAQLLMTILFLFLIYVLSRQAAALVLASSVSAQTAPPTVVIDSGHGGNDPGKIGVDGSLEKDLNLTIARKLKYYLETSGVQVIMTRDSDTGLYKETDSHKKTAEPKSPLPADQRHRSRPDHQHPPEQLSRGSDQRRSGVLL